MTTYTRVRVKPDTPEWLEERQKSLGASETAAVLGMSPFETAYDVYRTKHGHVKPFPPELALLGHMSEPIMHEWTERLSGLKVTLDAGFMARSKKYPWLHATFDRVIRDGRSITPVQFKTARFPWADGVPIHVRVQVQQEMLIAGAERALVVVLAAGRDFEYAWVDRDEEFISSILVPQTDAFWNDLQGFTPPLPMSMADMAGIWPSQQKSIVVTDSLLEAIERRNFHLAAAADEKAQADAVQLAIATYMEDHDTLVDPDGRVLATLKSQKGRRSVDMALLETEYPDVAAEVIRIGDEFKVLRMKKQEQAA